MADITKHIYIYTVYVAKRRMYIEYIETNNHSQHAWQKLEQKTRIKI